MRYILAFFMAFLIVLLIVPLLVRIAGNIGFVDKPTERKKHKSPTPLIGGIAMFIGFTAAMAAFFTFDSKFICILVCSALIMSIGIVDDWHKAKGIEFAVLPRFIIYIAACVIVFYNGIRFTGFSSPFDDTYILFPVWIQFALTIIWIFGVMTVINFSDGLDGLAGGLCSISSVTLLIVALYMGQTDSALICIILLGSILGFLKYNIFPAKIFMGDSGANFLGFVLAVISLHGAFKHATVVSIFIPVLALGVPIFDNIFVVIKRFIERKPIYKADASQIHYRLLNTGLSPVQACMFIFLISMCLNLTSIIILLLNI